MKKKSSPDSPWEFCSDCTFWLEYGESFGEGSGSIGECHLNPPHVIDPEVPFRGHIMTHEDDFCSHAVLRKGLVA